MSQPECSLKKNLITAFKVKITATVQNNDNNDYLSTSLLMLAQGSHIGNGLGQD